MFECFCQEQPFKLLQRISLTQLNRISSSGPGEFRFVGTGSVQELISRMQNLTIGSGMGHLRNYALEVIELTKQIFGLNSATNLPTDNFIHTNQNGGCIHFI